MYPWSSSGRKALGSFLPKKPADTVTRASRINAKPALWIRYPHQVTYPSVVFPKTRLNHLKKAPKGPRAGFFGFRSMAERAGLSVSALNAEKSTETAIVTANCL